MIHVLWDIVRPIERYLLTGDPTDPDATAEPEPDDDRPVPPVIFANLANAAFRRFNAQGDVVRAAQAWYDKIPDGSNVGQWAGDDDVALINAVRALRGLPAFDWNSEGPWIK